MTGVDEDCRTLEMYFDDLHRVKELVELVELVVSERVVTPDLFSSAAETKPEDFKQTRLQPCKVKNICNNTTAAKIHTTLLFQY